MLAHETQTVILRFDSFVPPDERQETARLVLSVRTAHALVNALSQILRDQLQGVNAPAHERSRAD
jgi:hypothetical protein